MYELIRQQAAKYIVTVMAFFITIALVSYSLPEEYILRASLSAILAYTFLVKPVKWVKNEGAAFAFDLVLVAASVSIGLYALINYQQFVARSGTALPIDIAFGIIALFLVLEATRRQTNLILPIIGVFFVVYGLWTNYFPGVFSGRGYDLERVMSQLYITDRGIYGMPLAVTIRYVVIFIIFGSVLQVAGASKYFIDFAKFIAGRFTGGIAQVANISSLAMGSISGSAVANVATTGSITIPTMKEAGYKPRFAGGVEAAASTGGQLMPPIMGAAAFIMASFLEMQYYALIAAAFIPALLYYLGVGTSIYFASKKMGIKPEKVEIENPKEVIKGGLLFLIPILVIIITLIVFKKTPVTAGFLGIVCALVASYFTKDNKITPAKLVDILYGAGKNTAIVCCPVAVAGIITAMINLTALSTKLSVILVDFAQGSLVLLLILTAISSIVMGMGVPTAVCYIVIATLIGPTVVGLGIDPLSAHMFIFYFGVLSMITPPVAFASYAASAIADEDPNIVSIEAVKIAASGFVIPFLFIYSPTLLMHGQAVNIVLSFLGHAVIIAALSAAIMGALIKPLHIIERLLLFGATICFILIPPHVYLYVFSLSIIAVVAVHHFMKNHKKKEVGKLA